MMKHAEDYINLYVKKKENNKPKNSHKMSVH